MPKYKVRIEILRTDSNEEGLLVLNCDKESKMEAKEMDNICYILDALIVIMNKEGDN